MELKTLANIRIAQMVSRMSSSWNVIINPNLEYGQIYWKDYSINGEDLDFDGSERLEFQSSSGLINNCTTGHSTNPVLISLSTGPITPAS